MNVKEMDIRDAEKIIENLNNEYSLDLAIKIRPEIIKKFKRKYIEDNYNINLHLPKSINLALNKCNTYDEAKKVLDEYFNSDTKRFAMLNYAKKYYLMPSRYLSSQYLHEIKKRYTLYEATTILDSKLQHSFWIRHGLINKGFIQAKREYVMDILHFVYLVTDKNIEIALSTDDLMSLEALEVTLNSSQDVFTVTFDNFDAEFTFNDEDTEKFKSIYLEWFENLYNGNY